MIPADLVGQSLEMLQGRGYSANDMSAEQKQTALWWDEHYRNAHTLPLAAMAEERYIRQGYKKIHMTFLNGRMPVWTKNGA